MKRHIPFIILLLTACTLSNGGETPSSTLTVTVSPPTTSTITSSPTNEPTPVEWWREAVFYEIYVRSFQDSDGDGIGDLNGLISRLDYLNDGDPGTSSDLGVTALWLMPIYPSPSVHSYDATDFYDVKTEYGSLEDFRQLVEEVHRRGMRLILDLPLNHTSSEHPWFLQSLDPTSPYRDWYIWSDTDPGFTGPWGRQVWHARNGAYYYGYFWEGMPDLHYTNPEVTAEMQNVTRFWLEEMGIDGFRLDAILALIEEGSVTSETRASHEWFRDYFSFYKGIKEEAMTIAELWEEDALAAPWVRNNEVDMAFDFDLAAAMIDSLKEGNNRRLLDTLRTGTSLFPEGRYGTFLANHDMARVMTLLGGEAGKAKAGSSLYFSLPGVPFIYYGEEIGLFGEIAGGGGRAPMQWDGSMYAGFSERTPWLPVGEQFTTYNVADETDDPDSLLSHYRRLIALRNSHTALRSGELYLPETSNPRVFACLRTSPEETLLVLVNLSGSSARGAGISLDASPLEAGKYTATSLLEERELATMTVFAEGEIMHYVPLAELPPYGTLILKLEK